MKDHSLGSCNNRIYCLSVLEAGSEEIKLSVAWLPSEGNEGGLCSVPGFAPWLADDRLHVLFPLCLSLFKFPPPVRTQSYWVHDHLMTLSF